MNKNNALVTTLLRYVMGSIFLWAFVDKTFGLGFATKSASAWMFGGSPTYGFLTYAAKGPFAGFFHSLAGNPLVDWMFIALDENKKPVPVPRIIPETEDEIRRFENAKIRQQSMKELKGKLKRKV
jgi:hypothetical protein